MIYTGGGFIFQDPEEGVAFIPPSHRARGLHE